MTVKNLYKEDIFSILEVYSDNFPDGWNKDMLTTAFDGGRFLCLGAEDNGVLLGVITVSLGLDDADIEGVVTKREFLRRGVAKTLIKSAMDEIKSLNLKKVFLEVRESNTFAKNLYESFGFSPVSVRKKYYSDGENAVVMVKEL